MQRPDLFGVGNVPVTNNTPNGAKNHMFDSKSVSRGSMTRRPEADIEVPKQKRTRTPLHRVLEPRTNMATSINVPFNPKTMGKLPKFNYRILTHWV